MNVIINKNRKIKTLYDEVNKHKEIYSLMYSPAKTSDPIEEQIISISTSRLDWNDEKTEFFYVWGWPGPDYNTYSKETYGKGWAYTKKEIINAWR